MIVAQFECPVQQTIHVDLLVNHLIGRRRLAFFDEVAAAKLFRSQTYSLGDFIQLPLERKNTLWRAATSESTVRRHVRRHCPTLDADIRAVVRAGGVNGSAG